MVVVCCKQGCNGGHISAYPHFVFAMTTVFLFRLTL